MVLKKKYLLDIFLGVYLDFFNSVPPSSLSFSFCFLLRCCGCWRHGKSSVSRDDSSLLSFFFFIRRPDSFRRIYFVRFLSYLLFFFLVSVELLFSSLFSTCDLYLIFDLTRDVRRTRRETRFSSRPFSHLPLSFAFFFSFCL